MRRALLNSLAILTIGLGVSLVLSVPTHAQNRDGEYPNPVLHCCQAFDQSCDICCSDVAVCVDGGTCYCR
jgi:hypothetical protein